MPTAGWNFVGTRLGTTGVGASQGVFYDTGMDIGAFAAYPMCVAFQMYGDMSAGGAPCTTVTLQWSSTTGTLTPIPGSPSFSFPASNLGFGEWECNSYPTIGHAAVYWDEGGNDVGGLVGSAPPTGVPAPISGAATLFFMASGGAIGQTFNWNCEDLLYGYYYYTPSPNIEVQENLYGCNGVFDHSAARGDVLKSLIGSMAGTVIPPGDLWHVFAGAYNPPTTILTDADLRDSIKGDFRVSRRDICNGVKGTFIPSYLPTNQTQAQPSAWRWTDFPPYQGNGLLGHPNYIAEDGGAIIWKEARFGFTTSIWMVQRLAKIVLQLLRFQISLHLPCKLTAFPVQAGDTITFIHARWAALANPPPTTFFVTQSTLVIENSEGVPTLAVDLVLRETDPSIYTFTAPSSPTNQGEYSSYGSLGTM